MNPTERAECLAETYADAILRLSYTYLKNTHDAHVPSYHHYKQLIKVVNNFSLDQSFGLILHLATTLLLKIMQ